RAEMYDSRTDEGPGPGTVVFAEDLGADRGGDEHQADQRRRCGADQQVEIMPAVKQLAQFRVHSCHPFDAAARDRRGITAPTRGYNLQQPCVEASDGAISGFSAEPRRVRCASARLLRAPWLRLREAAPLPRLRP